MQQVLEGLGIKVTRKDRTLEIDSTNLSTYKVLYELVKKMRAKIKQEGAKVVVEGVPCLSGNLVRASDIRAGTALVLAGLAAQGTTTIEEIHHIDRGYEELEENLSRLGANMVRIKE